MREFPFIKTVLSNMPRDMLDRNGVMTPQCLEKYFAELNKAYNKVLDGVPLADRPPTTQVLHNLAEAGIRIAEFQNSGRNVFILNQDISEALAHTNLDGVQLSDLHMPYSAFYMAFEQPLTFNINGDWQCLEGAYVRQSSFGITLSISVLRLKHRFGELNDVLSNIVIDLKQENNLTLAEAFDAEVNHNQKKLATATPLEIPTDTSATTI